MHVVVRSFARDGRSSVVVLAAAASLALNSRAKGDHSLQRQPLGTNNRTFSSSGHSFTICCCEEEEHKQISRAITSVRDSPSWIRRSLAFWNVKALPLPRVLGRNDPAFSTNRRLIQKRQEDELEMQKLVQQVIQQQERDPVKLRALNDKAVEVAFGEGVTLQKRQEFVRKYGCTAWTDDVLDTIVDLAKTRGIVELGAGNGQWSRAVSERYKQWSKMNERDRQPHARKKFEFLLAFDDQSALPLDKQMYHERTKIHHDYFFDKVQACDSDVSNVLRQWQCRGRVLMLVYPSPGNIALEAVQSYASISPQNDTVVYVGEGRGGANANDALFDYLENGEWILIDVMDVTPLGSKGYEKLYIVVKRRTSTQ